MNRRSILSLIAGAPLAGRAVADQAVTSLGNMSPPPYGLIGGAAQGQSTGPANIPFVEHQSALRSIFGDAKALAEIRAELAEAELRNNPYIDPDIQIMRSFSPMAKITFQRQRNVERALAEIQDTRWDRPQRYIRALQSRLDKMMWGKS